MKLHNGSLYWPTTLDTPVATNTAKIAPHYDVIVVGGGMSGALTAYTLAKEGMTVAVIDKRAMAHGSSSANTGLLQYANDIMLHELIAQIGEQDAVNFYRECQQAVQQLHDVARTLPIDPHFIMRKSICYASDDSHVAKVQKEYETLRQYGFAADYWDANDVAKHMPFTKPAALVTYGDAEVNPYRFVHGIFYKLAQEGVHLFEGVEALQTESSSQGVELTTSIGSFYASSVVYATGYDSNPMQSYVGSDINRSYAIATAPIADLSQWEDRAMIWETKRPYFYMRTTVDHRIIAGGLDEDSPEAPHDEAWIADRGKRIVEELQRLFPSLSLTIDYAWGASFGESVDNLPFIGRHPDKPHLYYLFGYGGNGTVYSMIGATLLRDELLGQPRHDLACIDLNRNYAKHS
ncbi:FAD dependent oxidoreductase [Fictibacillus macauensis ZFHKF-1]|uniref:FAD dependent oxidoreductase n=1 Tax=Fictibacillus macauensis ZFHKF-1 TaxID=1196324 RepID=I8AMY7_9BACL|nr:FAD-binding oxidoreductase [Fictibacillus macauensis]EIT87069.1 FAD dependent oxidoreductase [Fictibacillus macauensis ZFHKF-1]